MSLLLREFSRSQFAEEEVPETSEIQKQVNDIVNLMDQQEIPGGEVLRLEETRIDNDIQFGSW